MNKIVKVCMPDEVDGQKQKALGKLGDFFKQAISSRKDAMS